MLHLLPYLPLQLQHCPFFFIPRLIFTKRATAAIITIVYTIMFSILCWCYLQNLLNFLNQLILKTHKTYKTQNNQKTQKSLQMLYIINETTQAVVQLYKNENAAHLRLPVSLAIAANVAIHGK